METSFHTYAQNSMRERERERYSNFKPFLKYEDSLQRLTLALICSRKAKKD